MQGAQLAPAGGVPQPHGLVFAGRGDNFSIRGKRDRRTGAGETAAFAATDEIPNPCAAIGVGRDQRASIRCDRQRIHRIGMAAQREHRRASGHGPDARAVVETRADQPLAIRRKCQRRDIGLVPA